MIQRTFSAAFINSVLNHPSVKEGAELKEFADVSGIVQDVNNFVLVNEFGGFIVIKRLPGVYECHTQFLPEGRGQFAVDAVKEALDYMFINTDCQRIITKVNVNNQATRMFAMQFFKRRGTNGDYGYFSLDLESWIESSNACGVVGKCFHDTIEESVTHADDSVHNSYVGAAILMAQHGNIYKGQLAYNRWAVMAGYEPLVILTETPLVAKCGNMVLSISKDEVKICH